ncbi:NADPH-dependent FMN reductase [Sulfuriferula thiophila]|uniref:NADPH-dependent FMN reductase n=1 Tax=Sulfuriferula thiophila TaxID=1781211 RepID=UPI001CB89165|nr:NAD(P)H-dependent oxidoreductase [Sulfuriferula thiophila]
MIKILGFAGSLRKDSYNRALLLAAQKLVPDGAEIEIVDIGSFPLYNEDLEASLPAAIADFKAKLVQADAILMVTPEYNYSISGVLKNALDWASRPYGSNSFDGKPVAIMGATSGTVGTARAQYHLRQICVFLNAYVLNRPEIMVSSVADKFKDGELVDDKTKQKVREQLVALMAWTRQLHKD